MEHLLRAAGKGKEVTVVVELMARFDEEANLSIAARLEEVGAHVVYGVVGYKTHAKMLMVLRREDHGYRRYVHLGTGNYHPRTTRFYTDFGLLTANPEIGEDVNEVFKQLTGLGKASALKHLWQAPFSLHSQMLAAIQNEITAAIAGKPARIIAKMNSLLEPEIITALYEASAAGVTIDLIVRGVCSLRPGVKGLSENIRVRSVVGRFLEHHRIFYFHADGAQNIYLASADWMERNFFRRIEICFPVLEPKLKRRVLKEGLKPYLADNAQAWQRRLWDQGISPQPHLRSGTAVGRHVRRRDQRSVKPVRKAPTPCPISAPSCFANFSAKFCFTVKSRTSAALITSRATLSTDP
jgi:polyphosphate kinase